MKVSFQTDAGHPSLGIAFFWRLALEAKQPLTIVEHFIPELFYDYIFIQKGRVQCRDKTQKSAIGLGQQTLKTLHTRPLELTFSTPLVLFGARLSLKFAEGYGGGALTANTFLDQVWANPRVKNFPIFCAQITAYVQRQHQARHPYPMLSPTLAESEWLANYSPRQKRRLYQTTFGASRKALHRIHSVHAFLEQVCDFGPQSPRIIQHVNPEVFYDQPHLNHAFKALTRLSPVDYFEANAILQDNLMAASYNARTADPDTMLA